jgi:hypothetical protein
MKGRLIKTDVNYILEDDKGVVIASTSLKKEGLSLSLKNCQAIERGYDLNEEMSKLVDKKAEQNNTIDLNAYGQGCLDAFQKALEIIGDKKFSEDDMRMAFFHVQNSPFFNEFIQSLQQTEWDVEVETVPALSNNGNVYYGDIPKLDADGCLILKRI